MKNSSTSLAEETASEITISDTAQLVDNEEASTSNYSQLNKTVTFQESDEDDILGSHGVRRRYPVQKIEPGSMNILSAKYESLDYDTCENHLLLDEERKRGYAFIVWKDIARWFIILQIGVVTALIAFFIDICIEEFSKIKYRELKKSVDTYVLLDQLYVPYLLWVLSNICIVFIGSMLVAYVEPVAAGSGIPQVKCYLNGVKVPRVVRIKTLIVKAVGVITAVVGGLAGGKEGPMIHSGAVVAAGICQGKSTTFNKDFGIFQYFREDHEKRDFVSAGAAAGVSAAFGAPIGGVLFSLEEGTSFWNQALTWRTFFGTVMATFTLNCALSAYHGRPGELSYPGVYSGDAKPSNLDAYLGPFVDEMNQIEKGFTVTTNTGTEKNVKIRIRAFICDSPARAMIKGVCNFNGKHGCLKCTVVGEYSHKSNIVTFPKFDCPKRNDEDFRKKKYEGHHKQHSPLLKLKIDMVEDIPVSDSLHLIDLGVMKRLLIGWRDGNFGIYLTKWRAQDINKVNSFLINRKMPKEIHRSVRAIDVLVHWKGSEFRSFLYYLSFIILKDVLRSEAYAHFMYFFCAISICSNEKYFYLLTIAEGMLQYFAEHFKAIYGRDYVTSNIHNLTHLVDEVRKFGILQSFNAYPFENKLYCIKNMIRQGNKTLHQVARRLNEKQLCELHEALMEDETKYPYLKKKRRGESSFILQFKSFALSTKYEDKWFLSNENHVVELASVCVKNDIGETIEIYGNHIENTHDAFEEPLKSSYLHIYQCTYTSINKTKKVYKVSDIKCKLVCVLYDQNLYFVPLLHTFNIHLTQK